MFILLTERLLPFAERLLLRPPPEDEDPPLRATLVLVLLLADANPREVDFLAAPAEDFRAVVVPPFLAAVLLEEELFDADLVLAEDLAVPRFAPPLVPALLEEDPRDAVLEAPREADFLAVPRALFLEALREEVLLPFLAELSPLFAVFFDADFLAAVFLPAVFLAAALREADFLAAVFLVAVLEEAFLAVPLFDEALELPRPDVRPLEAVPLRPEVLEADLVEDLPPARFPAVFLEAAFLVDLAMFNGF